MTKFFGLSFFFTMPMIGQIEGVSKAMGTPPTAAYEAAPDDNDKVEDAAEFKPPGPKSDSKDLMRRATQNDVDAIFSVGLHYEFGVNVKDATIGKAFTWYLKAAELGHAYSQLMVARMYTFGQGVKANPTKAEKWLKKAAQNRMFSGGILRQELNKKVLYDKTEEPALAADKPNRGSILVVEDSPTIQRFVRDILGSAGYQVDLANDGIEGVEAMEKKKKYAAIISDINMPRMNGISMISHIRQTLKITDIPIVVLTTESSREIIMTAGKYGVNGWIIKPPQPEHLIDLLNKVFEKKLQAAAKKAG